MTTIAKTKLGRNDICNCGSGIKYKKCCESKADDKFKNGQSVSSEMIKICIDAFKIVLETHKVIDITNDLSEATYKKYQLKNYNDKVIMLAEKNQANSKVFETRTRDDLSNIIVLYKGSYRTLIFEDLADLMKSICDMIDESDNRDNSQ